MADYPVDGHLIGFAKSADWKGPSFIFFSNFASKWRLRVTKHRLRGARNAGPLEGIVLVPEVYRLKDGTITGDAAFNRGPENTVCHSTPFIATCGNYHCSSFCGYWNMTWILEMFVKYSDQLVITIASLTTGIHSRFWCGRISVFGPLYGRFSDEFP